MYIAKHHHYIQMVNKFYTPQHIAPIFDSENTDKVDKHAKFIFNSLTPLNVSCVIFCNFIQVLV